MRSYFCLVFLSGVVASGCIRGRAEIVQSSSNAGVLRLVGNREEAKRAAHDHMISHCDRYETYTILHEGQFVPLESTETSAAAEWRMSYQCGRAQIDNARAKE